MLHDIRCPEPLPAEPTQPTRREVFNVWTSLSPFNATPMTWWTGVWNDDGGSSHRHQLLIISTSFHKIQHPLNAPLIPSPTESDSPIQKSTGPPIDPPCVVLRRSPRDAWSWRIRSHSRCPPHPSGLIQTSQVQHGPIEPPSKKTSSQLSDILSRSPFWESRFLLIIELRTSLPKPHSWSQVMHTPTEVKSNPIQSHSFSISIFQLWVELLWHKQLKSDKMWCGAVSKN